MDKLIQKIQASRNVADPTLYGGALQDNTDLYFKANKLYSQSDVPDGPSKIFRMYGATVELDNRQFMSLGLQAPRNPEQEALNEYFNRQRTRDFAVAQSRMNVSEQLDKQAELMANNVIRDEMDRRAGIRRTVLEATGYTPAQIQQELAADALGGINQTAMDIRERQVQDAVNLYYSLNNIPLPVTTAGGVQGAIAATVPTVAATQLPADDAEAAVATDMAGLDAAGAADEEDGAAAAGLFGGAANLAGTSRYDGQGGAANASGRIPEEVRGIAVGDMEPLRDVSAIVKDMSTQELLDYIARNMNQVGLTMDKDGRPLPRVTRKSLENAVIEHMTQASRLSRANNQGIGGGK